MFLSLASNRLSMLANYDGSRGSLREENGTISCFGTRQQPPGKAYPGYWRPCTKSLPAATRWHQQVHSCAHSCLPQPTKQSYNPVALDLRRSRSIPEGCRALGSIQHQHVSKAGHTDAQPGSDPLLPAQEYPGQFDDLQASPQQA